MILEAAFLFWIQPVARVWVAHSATLSRSKCLRPLNFIKSHTIHFFIIFIILLFLISQDMKKSPSLRAVFWEFIRGYFYAFCIWIIDWVSVHHQCWGWKIKMWKWCQVGLWKWSFHSVHRIMTGSKHLHPEPWLIPNCGERGAGLFSPHLCSVGPQAVALAPVVTSSSTAPSHWLLGHHRSPGGRGSKTTKAPPVGEVLVPGGVRGDTLR